MARLYWPKNSYFTDRQRGERYDGPGEFDVPEDAVDHYLSRGWKRVDDGETDTDADSESDADDAADEGADSTRTRRINPEEYTIVELETELADVEDEDALVALRELEQEQKDRAGAVSAIDDRLDDVREA